mgnify:CR=1 FL=1
MSEKRKVVVVYLGSLYSIPPAKSLLTGLASQDIEVYLVITKGGINESDSLRKKITVLEVEQDYQKNVSLTRKMFRMLQLRKNLWDKIDSVYDQNTILWITSDVAVKNLGSELLKRRYVLQMYELLEKSYVVPKYKFRNIHIDNYARNALRVIQPEYNRAHIVKAWWGLNKLPFILENKPFYQEIGNSRKLNVTKSAIACDVLEDLKDKKIVLYQGILHKERPLDSFIKAIDELGSEYAFVVMSDGENLYKNVKSQNYYFIPYIEAPYHLEVTSHAYIGVLSYVPVKTSNSILNAVYCAPNKTFEYTRFGVPMISNDVPALDYLFEKYKCGKCIDLSSTESIKNAIKAISQNYMEYEKNAKKYYESVDYQEKIGNLLDEVYDE